MRLECEDWAVLGYDPKDCCCSCHEVHEGYGQEIGDDEPPPNAHGKQSRLRTEQCCGLRHWMGERFPEMAGSYHDAPRWAWAAVVRAKRVA